VQAEIAESRTYGLRRIHEQRAVPGMKKPRVGQGGRALVADTGQSGEVRGKPARKQAVEGRIHAHDGDREQTGDLGHTALRVVRVQPHL
jgi:hypothetical protein